MPPVVHYTGTDQKNRKAWLLMEELEQIMRRIHVLFAKCEPYGNESDGKIIVPKKELFRLLEKLSYAVIRMMDAYEGTAESRERGLASYQREGEKIKTAAQEGADDVYAASLIYVDNMLEELHDVVADAKEELWEQYARTAGRLDAHARALSEDQEEIKQQLTAMAQGGKYLKIIEHENKRLQKMKEERARTGEDAYGDDLEDDWDEYGEEEEDEGDEAEDTQEEGDGDEASADGESGEENKKAAGGDSGEPETDSGETAAETENTAADAAVPVKTGEGGDKPASGKKPQKAKGKQGGKYGRKQKRPASRHARMVPDLEEEWAKEEQRPVRKIGTAIYEDVGQPYDEPVKRVSYEVKVNQAYFDQLGEGNVDLDAEYYQWKEEQEQAAAAAEGAEGADTAPEPDADSEKEKNKTAKPNKKDKKKRGLKFGK